MQSNCDAPQGNVARARPVKRKYRMCAHPGCKPNRALGATGMCKSHGGGKRCAHEGCIYSAEGATNFCKSHGGGKRCAHKGCAKSADGATAYCVTHGGGKRCAHEGCTKGAEGATDFCVRHGGGKRCALKGCTKSAEGATDFCVRHGGGKRCAHKGCTKGARGATEFCKGHGGGKRCAHKEGCGQSAQGATEFCKRHGGGKRCPNCATWPDSRSGNRKYDGHCATCFKRIFPTDPRSKVIYAHTKEILVQNALNKRYKGFAHNEPLYTGECDCTHRRRVDHRKLINGTLLCVETDEHAHAGYDKRDEEIRYDDLFMVHSGKWIFIRFNPDGRGVDMEDKLARLMEEVEMQTGRIEREENTELLEIVKLFY
jgi:hypothetical protein